MNCCFVVIVLLKKNKNKKINKLDHISPQNKNEKKLYSALRKLSIFYNK